MASGPIRVQCDLDSEYGVRTDIRGHKLVIDQPARSGGHDEGPTPPEMFLFSVGGCVGAIARIIAHQERIALRGMSIEVSGAFDSQAVLGKNDNHPGFDEVTISASIDTDMSAEEKQTFLDRVCKRCPLHDSMVRAINVTQTAVA